ncbi:prolyl oligopeptidase family serine peptidase [Chitinophagales bacterium]|nr:prolyl oligopeptidase family serine peptidase [Chitinophagales bacterium]
MNFKPNKINLKYITYPALATVPLIVGLFAGSLLGVHLLTRRDRKPIRKLRQLAQSAVKNVSITAEDGVRISAWYVARPGPNIVILLSGRGTNREENINRAAFYLDRGYSVLLPDLRATGNSEGDRITFGWEERKDLIAWYQFLQAKGYHEVAAHGFSLGAATICYALTEIVDFNFIVLEACYTDLRKTGENWLRRMYIPGVASYLIQPLMDYTLSLSKKKMKPLKYIKKIKCPLFIMGGRKDELVPPKVVIKLFAANTARVSRIYFFEDGEHENYSIFYPEEYNRELAAFLESVHHLV